MDEQNNQQEQQPNDVETRISALEATVAAHETRITELETELRKTQAHEPGAASGSGASSVTVEEFKAMSLDERKALKDEDEELYNFLVNKLKGD
jgi:predicted component of type VI protein secretion system